MRLDKDILAVEKTPPLRRNLCTTVRLPPLSAPPPLPRTRGISLIIQAIRPSDHVKRNPQCTAVSPDGNVRVYNSG